VAARNAQRSTKAAPRSPPASTRTTKRPAPVAVDKRYAKIEQERDKLKAELAAAKSRISELERQREDVINRIDWVIDSLHNVLETEG